ncbi:MAG TPA: tetratricopeptide repeat protein, partial [Planctomycetes bacterium]|nr:tetratricopeptide repeat protein [Planctomycetota bacterium]
KKKTAKLYANFARRNGQHELASQAQYMAALAALTVQDYDAAARHGRKFLADYPGDKLQADVSFLLAESQLLLGRHDDAERQYREFLQLAPNHDNAPQAQVRRGVALYMADRYARAVEWLQPLVAQFSDRSLRSEALSVVGRSQLAQESFASARDSLLRAISVDPGRQQHDETLLALADVYRQLGEVAAAEQQWRRVLTQYPNSPLAAEAAFRLGETAFAAERFDDALERYSAVTRAWPDSEFAPHSQYGLGWTLFTIGEYQEASVAMTDLVARYRTSPVAPKGLYVKAMAAYQLGEYPTAIRNVQSFLATKPDSDAALDAQYVMGLAQAGLRQFEAATKTYATILSRSDTYPAADKVAYELGWAWIELGNTEEAVA